MPGAEKEHENEGDSPRNGGTRTFSGCREGSRGRAARAHDAPAPGRFDAVPLRTAERAIRRASPSSSAPISALPSCAAGPRAITTRSRDNGRAARRRRNHSRTPRFTRFRTTAFPTRRLALSPSRCAPGSAPGPLAATTTTNARPEIRRPSRETRRKSRGSRTRSDRRKRPVVGVTATSKRPRRPDACAPSSAAASGRSGPRASSSARGIRGCGVASSDSADRFSSSQDRSRLVRFALGVPSSRFVRGPGPHCAPNAGVGSPTAPAGEAPDSSRAAGAAPSDRPRLPTGRATGSSAAPAPSPASPRRRLPGTAW